MKKSSFLPLIVSYYYHRAVLSGNTYEYMAVASAGAGAEIMNKGGAGAENKIL